MRIIDLLSEDRILLGASAQTKEQAIDQMLQRTNTSYAPWHIVESNCKYYARIKTLRLLTEALEEAVRDFGGDGWSVLPATPCVLAKLRGTYRWHIVVKCPADADLSDALLPLFRRRKPDRDANVAVDVDPDDLL